MRAIALFLLAAIASAEAIRLAENPALSPDGKTLVFSWRGDIWSVASTGGKARRLTTHPAEDRIPQFSPNGRRIAFVSARAGANQVFVMDVPDGRPVQVTFHSEGSVLQDWYPDGTSVLVSGPRDHYWRRAGRLFRKSMQPDSPPVLLFNGYGGAGKLSPDGTRLLFSREGSRWSRKQYTGAQASQVWTYDLEQKEFRKLSQGEHEERWPVWAPDGKRAYVVSQADGTFNLYELQLAGGKRRKLTQFEDDGVVFPAISRDGSTIVFRRLFDLYRLDVGGDMARLHIESSGDFVHETTRTDRLTAATQAAFTDDGREIVFVAGGDLWVMDTELKEPVQVTFTDEEERDPVFSPDHKSIVYVSHKGGQCDIWKASRADGRLHWWQNRKFSSENLTRDPQTEAQPRFVADGRIAYTALRGDLWTIKPDGTEPIKVLESWSKPSYSFSPDGRWVAYAIEDDDFNSDIWIKPASGTGEAINISRHPDWETQPVWSPDGKMLAFVGNRARDESDIHYVYLRKQDDDKTKRDRTIEKALEVMKKRKVPGEKPKTKPEENKKKEEKKPEKKAAEEKKEIEVRIDFDDIADRIHRISIRNAVESGLMWSPDSKKLAFSATIDGKEGLYTVAIPDEPKPVLHVAGKGSGGRWLEEDDKIVWLQRGQPTAVVKGKPKAYGFSVQHRIDIRARNVAIFDLAWLTVKDFWYDDRMNNRDWDTMRRKYRPAAAACVTDRELNTVVALMLGELNGSHLGFRSNATPPWRKPGWNDVTAHLGVRFDPEFSGPGLRVKDVIKGSPALREASRLHIGDVILTIDGQPVSLRRNLGRALLGKPERSMLLAVKGADGKSREVILRPTTFPAVRRLLYEEWLDRNRAKVDEASKGALGYLHVRGMSWPSFERFEAELYKVGHGKQGLIIDVRNNGGGFTADHLLTCLTQPEHAITVPRGGGAGYPQGRMVYARWSKPIVVLCNQNSFSNAEIFAHAIKTLKRGRLVGVRTAGGVISTGGRRLMGVAFVRLPFRGWFVRGTGQDMELNGAAPHFTIWPKPTEMPRGKDRQLDKAVSVLLEDVEAWKKRPKPKLVRKSER